MKLIAKYNRVNLIATVIILLISAICYYFLLRSVLITQLDKDLKVEEREITDYIKENDRLPEATNYKDEQEEFIPLNNQLSVRKFSSIDIFNKEHREDVSYRQLEFPAKAAGRFYKIMIRKSQEETDDLVELILKITLGILLILLITLFFINRFFLNKLWKPFNTTLQQIKQFNLSGKEKVTLEKTDINEFIELNHAVTIMTNSVSQDYDEIKNFTENASHEIQTPLAIIKSRLELLSQSENLTEDQMNSIQSTYEATNRLSRLNQSLILLTKIDNRQFKESEKVKVSQLINKHLANYEELLSAKFITVNKNIKDNVTLQLNEALAEIVVSNLITNAIKHNVEKGDIEIILTDHIFSISNTGLPLQCDPLELFERFKKDKVSSESLGLGLSIVKKICERYKYQIHYNYVQPLHTIIINF